MVPIPRFATWDAFNDYLEEQCRKRQADVLRGQSETIGERLARDLAAMSDLPAAPFDACDQATGGVSSQASLSVMQSIACRSTGPMSARAARSRRAAPRGKSAGSPDGSTNIWSRRCKIA